jgi:rubredoxin
VEVLTRKNKIMPVTSEIWQCQTSNCGYMYNPEKGDRKGKIPKGTPFDELPEDWKCPVCGASKKMFRPMAIPSVSTGTQ